MGALIEVDDFTDADDLELEPIKITVPFRDAAGKKGVEDLWARPRIPFGILFQIETADPAGAAGLISGALLKDDLFVDGHGDPEEGTSSYDRWQKLTLDPDREIPGKAITQILQGLYTEYSNRRNPTGAPARPTKQSGRSSGRQSRTGRSSTAARGGQASTSVRVLPTSD